jgi:hypothetical protein
MTLTWILSPTSEVFWWRDSVLDKAHDFPGLLSQVPVVNCDGYVTITHMRGGGKKCGCLSLCMLICLHNSIKTETAGLVERQVCRGRWRGTWGVQRWIIT